MSSEPYTTLQVETQIIVWETLLTIDRIGNTKRAAQISELWTSLGTPFMRHEAIRVGAFLSDVFNDWQVKHPDQRNRLGLGGFSFDFRIVPFMLRRCPINQKGFSLPDPADLHRALSVLAHSIP